MTCTTNLDLLALIPEVELGLARIANRRVNPGRPFSFEQELKTIDPGILRELRHHRASSC